MKGGNYMSKTPKHFSHLKDKFVTIVALGDSITAINHWTYGALNWAGLLWQGLGQCFPKGYTVINSGISGDSAAGGLARLERDVLRFDPDIIFISFGTNDCSKTTPALFKRDLREMIRRIRAHGPCKIILRTPNPLVDFASGQELTVKRQIGKTVVNNCMKKFAQVIVEVAERDKTLLVDHYACWTKSMKSKYAGEMRLLMGDSCHPNANGHRRLYHEIAPIFKADLKFQHEWEHLLMMPPH